MSLTWDQLIELQTKVDELNRKIKTNHEKENILQEFLRSECKRKKLKITTLSIEKKREIVSSKTSELIEEEQALQSQIKELSDQIKIGVDQIDLSTIPRDQSITVGEWSAWSYSTQTDNNGYALYRAKAEMLKWENLGFEASVRTHFGVKTRSVMGWSTANNTYYCDVKISGPVNLVQYIPIFHMKTEKWLQLIYDNMPACNVKVLFHNHSLRNRWDVE